MTRLKKAESKQQRCVKYHQSEEGRRPTANASKMATMIKTFSLPCIGRQLFLCSVPGVPASRRRRRRRTADADKPRRKGRRAMHREYINLLCDVAVGSANHDKLFNSFYSSRCQPSLWRPTRSGFTGPLKNK